MSALVPMFDRRRRDLDSEVEVCMPRSSCELTAFVAPGDAIIQVPSREARNFGVERFLFFREVEVHDAEFTFCRRIDNARARRSICIH